MSRYLNKLTTISKARNSPKTAAKVRGLKWTEGQLKKIRVIAAQEEMPTLANLPKLGDYKAEVMLRKIKQLRKEMSQAIGTSNPSGIRNSTGEGVIYLVEHELYEGWVKCGMTTNMKKRLGSYNCSDPLKRFSVLLEKSVSDRRKSESLLIHNLKSKASLSKGEWFRINKVTALEIFNAIS